MNFKIPGPSLPNKKWAKEEPLWSELNKKARGNSDFYPLTVKGAYVFGLIHDLCESVELLLGHQRWREVTFLPAYGVAASAVELLGKCIDGNTTGGPGYDLQTGFRFLASAEYMKVPNSFPLLKTPSDTHTISQLLSLRHFAAHGQGGANLRIVDLDILRFLLSPLKFALERYWNILQVDEGYCERLALANVSPRQYSPVRKSWVMFQEMNGNLHPSVTDVWSAFFWPGK